MKLRFLSTLLLLLQANRLQNGSQIKIPRSVSTILLSAPEPLAELPPRLYARAYGGLGPSPAAPRRSSSARATLPRVERPRRGILPKCDPSRRR